MLPRAILKINNKDSYNSLHINEFNNIYALSNEEMLKNMTHMAIWFLVWWLDTGTKDWLLLHQDLTTDSSNNIYVLDKG